jgi:hypothetical protein
MEIWTLEARERQVPLSEGLNRNKRRRLKEAEFNR